MPSWGSVAFGCWGGRLHREDAALWAKLHGDGESLEGVTALGKIMGCTSGTQDFRKGRVPGPAA